MYSGSVFGLSTIRPSGIGVLVCAAFLLAGIAVDRAFVPFSGTVRANPAGKGAVLGCPGSRGARPCDRTKVMAGE